MSDIDCVHLNFLEFQTPQILEIDFHGGIWNSRLWKLKFQILENNVQKLMILVFLDVPTDLCYVFSMSP